jgi:dipeptidase E
VTSDQRRIVAIGGGTFTMGPPEDLLLERFVLSLTAVDRPRVCFVATASGDSDTYVKVFYQAMARLDCQPTDLPLFARSVANLESFVLSQDVIFVGGGSTANLLAVWRVHGLDSILRKAWSEGVLLCGVSAGMNCWFEGSITDSFDVAELAALPDGLGLLSGSCCPHYDGESKRRPAYETAVASGRLEAGFAADDGAALVFAGEELVEVVGSRPSARAYRVQRCDDGVVERELPTRYLG